MQWQFFAGMKLTLHTSQVHSYSVVQWWACSALMCPLVYLQRRVAKDVSGLFCCWSLFRNNTGATNLKRFTFHHGSRRFVAWDCWTHISWQVMQRDSDMLIAVSHVHLYFVKRSMSESTAVLPQVWKNPLLVRVWPTCPSVKLHLCRRLFMQYKITWLVRIHLCKFVGMRLR